MEDPETGIRCHYTRAIDEAICSDVLAYAKASWEAQVDRIGWPAPQPDGTFGGTDGLDFFLDTSADGGAWTSSDYRDADPDDGRMGSAAYIVLDPRIDASVMHLYVAHEFNHVLQFGMDFTEASLTPWEAAATVSEEDTYPGEGSWLDTAGDYLLTPWESLLGDGWHLWADYEIWSYYEYGAAYWLEHLRNVYGVEPVDYWWALTNETPVNEPDAWDAYDTVTGDAEAALVDLLIAQARTGSPGAPDWAQSLDATVTFQGELAAVNEVVSPTYAPYDLGAVYFSVTAEGEFTLEITGDAETRWLTVWIEGERVLGSGESFSGPGTLAIASLGPEDFDPDLYCQGAACRFEQREISVELLAAADLAERNPQGEEVGLSTCACSQGPRSPRAGSFLAVLLLGCALRTRRRSQAPSPSLPTRRTLR